MTDNSSSRSGSFRWTRNRNIKNALGVDEFLPSEDLPTTNTTHEPQRSSISSHSSSSSPSSTPPNSSRNSRVSISSNKNLNNNNNNNKISKNKPKKITKTPPPPPPLISNNNKNNNNNNNLLSEKQQKQRLSLNSQNLNNNNNNKPLPSVPNQSNNQRKNDHNDSLNEFIADDGQNLEQSTKEFNNNNNNNNDDDENNIIDSNSISPNKDNVAQKRISELESKVKLLTIENTELKQNLDQLHKMIGEKSARENNLDNSQDSNDISDTTLKAIRLLSSRAHIHLEPKLQESRVQQGISELRSIRTLRKMKDALDLSHSAGDTDLMGFILLHMKGNLKENIFFSVLASNQFALKIYINMQKQRKAYAELQRLYKFMNMPEESVMLSLYRAYDIVSPQDPENPDIHPGKGAELLNELKRILPIIKQQKKLFHFVDPVEKHIALLEKQIRVEDFDAKVAAAGRDPMYLEHPRFNIINKPLGTTLYYCLFYHPYVGKDKISSPARMRKEFEVSERRWEWTALRARAGLGDWKAVKNIPNIKVGGIFSRNTVKSPLGMSSYVDIVLEYNGPEELAMYFLQLIKNKETKLATAMKYNMYQIAIDTIIEMKNRERMVELRQYLVDALPPEKNEPYLHQIDQALTSNKIKWKKKRFSFFN